MLYLPVICAEEGIVVVATSGVMERLLWAICEENAHAERPVH